MASRSPLLVNAVELLRVPGSERHVRAAVPLDDLEIDDPRLAGDVAVDLALISTIDDVEVRGELAVSWSDECRRCLRPLADDLRADVEERYAEPGDDRLHDPTDLSTFAIQGGQLDLRPMVRESVLLAVPDAPLCRDDCPGLCPVCGADQAVGPCGCTNEERDERWAVLDQLRDQ